MSLDFKTFDAFKKLIAANPEILNVIQSVGRDATQVASLPSRARGAIKRGAAELGEGVAGLVEKGAGFADKYQPQISLGEDGPSAKIPYNPLMPFDAADIAAAAGLAKEGLSQASDSKTAEEKMYDSAIEAMDDRIGSIDSPASSAPATAAAGAALAARAAAPAQPEESLEERKERYAGNKDKIRAIRDRKDAERAAASEEEEPSESGGFSDILAGISDQVKAGVEASKEPESDYTEEAISLFKNTHATEFDPKSSKDKGKLENMKKLLAKNKGKEMSPNQFALQFYREYP